MAPGPVGERGPVRSQVLAYFSESAPGTVVLNVVSDLLPVTVTVEEVDAEPEGEPVATILAAEFGPVLVWPRARARSGQWTSLRAGTESGSGLSIGNEPSSC